MTAQPPSERIKIVAGLLPFGGLSFFLGINTFYVARNGAKVNGR
jgi:hypothetical protein